MLRDQAVEDGKEQPVRPVGSDDEGRDTAGDICFRDIYGHLPRVGRWMAGRNNEPGGILGIDGSERIRIARNAGINLAVRRVHRELDHRSVWEGSGSARNFRSSVI